jgi:hypothetical protein
MAGRHDKDRRVVEWAIVAVLEDAVLTPFGSVSINSAALVRSQPE